MADPKLKPIAIVGLSAEMPSGLTAAKNLNHHEFFKFLLDKQESYEVVPSDRFNIESWHGKTAGKVRTKVGSFLKDINTFDYLEFGVSAKDAKAMSPSTRKLIEHSFLSLLDSGIDYRGRNVGCYTSGTDFDITNVADPDELEAQGSFAGIPCMIANKVSYHLDLTGPSIPVDTACSSSLVALHLAIQGLRSGDCEAAVVGGAQINHRFIDFITYSQGSVLAPDGKCKPFDASADGFSRGEGVCVVVVKLLEDAIRDRDYIYATVLNTGVNASGNAGPVSAPVGSSQQDAMHRAFQGTGHTPKDISYAELHATGTAVGDPTEANWVGKHMSQSGELLIGSVKGNVGHLEVCAFLASLSKACSIFEHNIIPPNANFANPNPAIKWKEYNIKVVQEPTSLPRRGTRPPLVSIMGSGIGGVNGHCLLQAPPQCDIVAPFPDSVKTNETRSLVLLTAGGLSVRSATSASESVHDLAEENSTDLANLSVVCGRRSRQFTWRSFVVATANKNDIPKFPAPVFVPRTPPHFAYVFSGQGPQHILMGRELFTNYTVFRSSILRMDAVHEEVTGYSLLRRYGLFCRSDTSSFEELGIVWPVSVTIPALAMVQMAIYDLLLSLGAPRPNILIGYSAGETAMLYAAGAMSQSMALEIAIARGIAMSAAEGTGTMAALNASVHDATLIIDAIREAYPNDSIQIACYNTDGAVTLAGTSRAIDHAVSLGSQRQFFARRLRTEVPVHSSLMECCHDQFLVLTNSVFSKYSSELPLVPRDDIEVYSTCTGERLSGPITAEYFWSATRHPVQFVPVVQTLRASTPSLTVVEISPHPVLNSYLISLGVPDGATLSPMRRPRREDDLDEERWLLDCLGRLITLGCNTVDFFKLNPSVSTTPTPGSGRLPTYPFARKTLPSLPSRSTLVNKMFEQRQGPLSYSDLRINAETHPELMDHVIMGESIMPAAGYIEMAFERGAQVLWNTRFSSMMTIFEDKTLAVDFKLEGHRFTINSSLESANPSTPRMHVEGYLSKAPLQSDFASIDISGIMARCQPMPVSAISYFAQFGSTYQRVISCYKNDKEALFRVKGLDANEMHNGYHFHPSILDSCIHSVIHPLLSMNADRSSYHLPSFLNLAIRHNTKHRSTEDLYSFVSLQSWSPENITYDCIISTLQGARVLTLLGLVITRHGRELLSMVPSSYDIQDTPWLDPLTGRACDVTSGEGIFGGSEAQTNVTATPLNIISYVRGSEIQLFNEVQALQSQGQHSVWIASPLGSTLGPARGFSRVLRNEMQPFLVHLIGFDERWSESDQVKIVTALVNAPDKPPYELSVPADGRIIFPKLLPSIPPSPNNTIRVTKILNVPNDHVRIQVIHSTAEESRHGNYLYGFVGVSFNDDGTQLHMGICSCIPTEEVVVHRGQTIPISYPSLPLITVARLALGFFLVGYALGSTSLQFPTRLRHKRILVDSTSRSIRETLTFLNVPFETFNTDDVTELLLASSLKSAELILSHSIGTEAQALRSVLPKQTRLILWSEVAATLQSCLDTNPWIASDLLGVLDFTPSPDSPHRISDSNQINLQELHLSKQQTQTSLFSATKAYVLLGGIGLVGLYLAEWMYENGARTIILTSRSGRATLRQPHPTPTQATLAYLESLPDLDLQLVASDASDASAMQSLIDNLPLPLGGCVLAAVVLSDRLLVNQTQESFDIAFAPKLGALQCLESTVDIRALDFLISLSSVAAWGSVGQSNYASANTAVEEAIKQYPNGFSIAAPYITDNVWRHSFDTEVEPQYVHWMAWAKSARQLCSWVGHGLRALQAGTNINVYVPDYDWSLVHRSLGNSSLYDHLIPSCEILEGSTKSNPKVQIQNLILEYIDVDESDFNADTPLTSYGLDSLAAGRLSWALKPFVVLTQFQLLGDICLADILKKTELSGGPDNGPLSVDVSPNAGVVKPPFNWDSLDRKIPIIPLVVGNETPLFLIHGSSGDIVAFMPLQDCFKTPLYGIQASHDAPLDSIKDLAAFYFKEIKQVRPFGPYRLAGYSGTCLVTIELAKLFKKNGDTISQFALLEYWPTLFSSPFFMLDDESFEAHQASSRVCLSLFQMLSGCLERDPRPQRKQIGADLWHAAQGRINSEIIRLYYETTLRLIHSSTKHLIEQAEGSIVHYESGLAKWIRESLSGLPVDFQALATTPVPHPDYPPYLARADLNRPGRLTVLPTPLPKNASSPANDVWFTDSSTQELVAVIDACLHNLYDVPRAKQIFERLMKQAAHVIEPRLFNNILQAYIGMASGQDGDNREYWLEEAWKLYQSMESSTLEKIAPSASTYALMLLAWLRFNPDSADPVKCASAQTPLTLLSNLIERDVDVPSVVSDRVFESDEEAAGVIKLLSKAAVDLNLSKVVSELGQTESIGTMFQDPLEGVPQVRPVYTFKLKQKKNEGGDDAKTPEIPFNLTNLRNHLADVVLARRVLPSELTARQKLLEESVYDVAVARLKHQAERFAELGINSGALNAPDLQKWMWEWHIKLQQRLSAAIKDIVAAETDTTPKRGRTTFNVPLAPFLQLVKPEKLSLITILEIMRLQGTGGVSDGMKTARALIGVGKSVEMEYKAQMSKKSSLIIPSSAVDSVEDSPSPESEPQVSKSDPTAPASQFFNKYKYKDLQARRMAAQKYVESGETWTAEWTQSVRLKIGSILVECLMDVAEVERTGVDPKTGSVVSEVQPAFFHSYEYIRGQKLGVIRLNPVVADRLAKDGLRETLHPRHLPMLVKPKPWLSHDQGGYFYNKSSAMRFKDSVEQLAYLKHASQLGNVELVYAGLDVLGSTPWKINKPLFDVVLAVWNSGERLGKMPPVAYDEPEPERPENFETDLKARSVYLVRQRAHNQAKANNHSERCSVNYKIEIARAFLGDTIYLPHNLDFRGRAYPIPPHLNHIGDDLSRGLLKFAEARPLGERGLRWLKIHLANLYGYDKASFDERVEFVMERLDDVFDSATRPLDGRRWWTQADDPWQCLATSMELHAALTSPDPHAFESSLPVHQDGTCNGLQHYAALGGDARGAAQVNLSAADRPSDVYTYVGKMVETLLDQDAEKGDKYALMLRGKITRKVVKQTVMTTVYGVTFVGARDQIEKQLRDRKDIPEEECWMAASYLAKQVLTCIGDLFSGAQHIQNWLNLCARLVSKSIPGERIPEAVSEHSSKRGKKSASLPQDRLKKEQMTSVVWTTPLGLPIVQPYRKPKRKQIMTSLQTVFISDPNSPAEVNSMKQASAFPPNFIHSLDATHMMLTALECRTQGLTFASVHDSYWTHACSIDKMSEIIRDTFIALHSSDVLVKLQEEFMERYKGYKLPLVHLRSPRLIKHLREAGARVVATPEQAKSLDAIKDLLVISETEKPTVEEAETSGDALADLQNMLDTLQKDAPASPSKKSSSSSLSDKNSDSSKSLVDLLLEEDDQFDEEDEEEDSRTKSAMKRKAKDDAATITLFGKFIDLTDILPPLPKKGDFNVAAIKKSQYFFS
ncbi:hypothetical protein ONZ45_g10994 [Pleurotus djamor]|nr:hypothetical protein ONZ45_g10994 [Pleurotus djamor]